MSAAPRGIASVLALWTRRGIGAPVAAVRPYLALKGTLLLLAFDMWLTRASHAGRYGAGGFNVAHWPWLDWVQPGVSPPLYVGACVLTAALCLAIVFADRPPRWLIGLTFLVHTWSWAMSMLDSYQHHYLLSIVLLAMAFFPPLTAEEALLRRPAGAPSKPVTGPAPRGSSKRRKKRKKKTKQPVVEGRAERPPILDPHPLTSAWAYALLCGSIAVVYAYTAFSKTDPEWLSGASLRRVLRLPADGLPAAGAVDPVGPFRSLLDMFGVEGDQFWYAMGHSVVLVQIICMAGYLLAPWRDATRSPFTRVFYWVAMFTALSFHMGAEHMGLEIGWFSYYMMGYALICFLPARWLVLATRMVIPPRGTKYGGEVLALRLFCALGVGVLGTWFETPLLTAFGATIAFAALVRWVSAAMWIRHLRDLPETLAIAVPATGGLVLVGVGWGADLPGAREASIIAAVLLAGGVVASLVKEGHARAMYGYGVGALFAGLAFLVCVQVSDMRWDYWRNVGGDHRRRGEVEEAYVAYVKANRYSPEDDDRLEREQEMRNILVQRGVLSAGSEE